jgi:hypothetical protein
MTRHTDHRRGAILVVVLALLALFAGIGILAATFGSYQAENARIRGDAANTGGREFTDDGKTALNLFLAQLIYPVADDAAGLNSSLRGHDLTRLVYGGRLGAAVPFDGVGTFSESVDGLPGVAPGTLNRRYMMNYRLFPGMTTNVYDPEYSTTTGRPIASVPGTSGEAYVPKSAPYTYPDLNNAFLAIQCPATGEIQVPSFVRQVAFGSLAPNNPNWTNAQGKYLLVRPRPEDHAKDAAGRPLFPYVPMNPDGTFTGDVQNLPGGYVYRLNPTTGQPEWVARNDSVWIDIGAPVIPGPDGKRYKMLVAPLILDLDGRLNLSVHGNRVRDNPTVGQPYPNEKIHASGVGIGPHEVSLEKAFGTVYANFLTEARTLVGARSGAATGGVPRTRADQIQKRYAPYYPTGQRLPDYAQVPWLGFTGPNPLALPAGTTQYHTTAIYSGGYDASNTLFNHPTLFNPTEWPTFAGGGTLNRGFAFGDTKLLSLRYAFAPSFYAALDVGNHAPTSLRGTYGIPNPNPPQFNTLNNHRLDPAHMYRNLVTTLSQDLDRGRLMPMYRDQVAGDPLGGTAGSALTRDPTTGLLVNPTTAQQFPAQPMTTGAVTDFASATQLNNARLAVGAVDLNRSLADYRDLSQAPNVDGPGDPDPLTPGTPTPQPLGPTNMLNEPAARMDRQRLARDVFARLVVATGAQATVATTTTTVGMVTYQPGDVIVAATAGTPEYNALRQLAQLAANIVDYVDPDDVSTVFVWNPKNPAPLTLFAIGDPTTDNFSDPADLAGRVVFGVEKPRLTLNEVYAEVTNDPADPGLAAGMMPTLPAHVRFWLEFQNPTPLLTGNNPLGTGAVKVRDVAGVNVYSPYRVEIVRNTPKEAATANVTANLRDPNLGAANVTGAIVGVAAPDLTFDFSSVAAGAETVPPANGVANGGVLVCAANVPMQRNAEEFNPMFMAPNVVNASAAVAMSGAPGGSLSYTRPLVDALDPDRKNNVVLLRRLANPHLPPSPYNPYITVDFVDNVPIFDAVQKKDATANDRAAKSAADMTGYDPVNDPGVATIARRTALGKVQPYAGMCNPGAANGDYATFTFPNSLVVFQSPVDATNAPAMGVWHTLGFQNSRSQTPPAAQTYVPSVAGTSDALLANAALASSDTLMTPYEWFVHLDRPLINQLELLHVLGGKPHEATLYFMVPNATTPGRDVVKHVGNAQWLQNSVKVVASGPAQYAAPAEPALAANTLWRAFDVLRVQPYGHQTAFGGLVQGRININTIQDKRVWDALFDAPDATLGSPGNSFDQGQVDAMWTALVMSRTRSFVQKTDAAGNNLGHLTPVPGATVYDMNADNDGAMTPTYYDRPFLPFGAPQLAAGSAFAFGGGVGIDDTILRRTAGTTVPMIWNPDATRAPHPYLQAEAARKILNNTTTVSNTFAVWVTVGYFEVVNDVALPNGQVFHQLGKEYFREVPGDVRHKFFSLVRRTHVGMDPLSYQNYLTSGGTTLPTHATTRYPFFTTLEGNSSAGTDTIYVAAASANPLAGGNPAVQVYSDGVPVDVTVGSTLVVGTGADREIVTVTAITGFNNPTTTLPAGTTPGYATLTVTPLTRSHAAGECVSNIVPGNPGPQPGFDLNLDMYRSVVPYWSRN